MAREAALGRSRLRVGGRGAHPAQLKQQGEPQLQQPAAAALLGYTRRPHRRVSVHHSAQGGIGSSGGALPTLPAPEESHQQEPKPTRAVAHKAEDRPVVGVGGRVAITPSRKDIGVVKIPRGNGFIAFGLNLSGRWRRRRRPVRLFALLTDTPARPGNAPVAAPGDVPIGDDAVRRCTTASIHAPVICHPPAISDSVDDQVVLRLLRCKGFHPKRLAAHRPKRAALVVTVVAGVVRRVDALAGHDARAGHDGQMCGEGVRRR